ncbi:GSCOCG00010912001-RA-CDS, partial [Cotesia congregata]
IFGEDPAQKEPELILHSSVAMRWKKYLSEGLKKEVKDSLMEKYPRRGKLSFEPPILNDKVAVNLKESALKRDKYFGATQKLAGSALAALAPAIESLAPLRDAESMKRLEQIWDAAKLLIEIHRFQTVARKACILPTLSKQWATALEKRVTDSYLFGEKLVDKVKEIKAIGKVGEEMKSAPVKKTFVSPGPLNAKGSSSQKKSVTQTG